MTKNYLFIFLFSFFISCNPEETTFLNEPLYLKIGSEENCEPFEISCPVGDVCDENYYYRAHSFNNEKLSFYISFNPAIVDNYNLESIKEHLNYINFTYKFPEYSKGKNNYYYSNKDLLTQFDEENNEGFKFNLENYENGILTGTLSGTMNEVTRMYKSNDPDCRIGDIIGTCGEQVKANIPFTAKVSFCLD